VVAILLLNVSGFSTSGGAEVVLEANDLLYPCLKMPDEEAFCLLVRLMHSYDLRGHFLPEMPKLQMRLFQVSR
jgi:hypothetical protein